MKIFYETEEWQAMRGALNPDLSIGFVPTMGNLHQGHAALISSSKAHHDVTVVSVFINPTQFDRPDDFTHYPRTLAADLDLLASLGVDYCLLPTEAAMYADAYRYRVEEHELCRLMEGEKRPGHFGGMLTVVLKLLHLVRPHTALFGEKDYQQYLLIRNMAKAFFLPVTIQVCPTVREASGLAYSSRNNRLTAEQRSLADHFARIFHQQEQSPDQIIPALQELGIGVDYVVDYESRRFAAVKIGDVRLIDNYAL